MLNKLRIGPKLLLAPGLVLALLMVTSASAWYGMVRQNDSLDKLVRVRAARLKAAADVGGEAKHAHANIYQLLAWTNGSFAQSRLDALTAQLRARHAAVQGQLEQLAALADPDERQSVAAAIGALAAYRKAVQDTVEMAGMDQSIATNAMAKAETQFGLLNAQLARLAAQEKLLSERAHAEAAAEFHTLGLAMALLLALSVALSLLVTMRVRGAMLGDIRGIAEVALRLAAGKLSPGLPAHGRDEIAETSRLLERGMGQLSQTLRAILACVETIDRASHEIASGNLDLSNRTELQAGSLERTASALTALTRAVHANAAHARQACELAASAAQLARHGGRAVGRAVTSMDSIRAGSRQIVDIIGVIDGIAFQTNILALNAAVEAAHAGGQGSGFAVVAAEVRVLAQRSAAAARQIKTLIAASAATIDHGALAVRQAGAHMDDMVASVQQVHTVLDRISGASAEQAQDLDAVHLAVAQIDAVTQQNAALVEQAAAAAASLQRQAETLTLAVSVFQLSGAPEHTGPEGPAGPDARPASAPAWGAAGAAC